VELKEAAEQLGVHYQTAYRWVRDGTLAAVKIGSSYAVSLEEIERFLARRALPAPPPKTTHVRSWALQVERLHRLVTEGDELGCRALVDRLHEGGVEPLVLCEALLAPTLDRIGDEWSCGRLSVAYEHRASAICERLLARIALHPRGRPRGIAVVCTPPGEQHGLPAAMAAVVLRSDRWQVHHLGTEVPTTDLVDLVRSVAADLVVLSLTNRDAKAEADHSAEALLDAGTRPLVGSPGRSLRELLAEARG
jgi:excisionase family DNA binding protein